MHKKRGFTLIEIAVTFSLVSVIVILLFQIIISLREVYIKGDIQTTFLSKQGIITKKINDDLQNLNLTSITSCGAFCITLEYENHEKYNLSIDVQNQQIQYHDYTWKLPEGASIGTVETTIYENPADHNAILKIDIPVVHKLLENDYGLHFIYQYNSNTTTIPTTIPKPANVTDEQHAQYSFFR